MAHDGQMKLHETFPEHCSVCVHWNSLYLYWPGLTELTLAASRTLSLVLSKLEERIGLLLYSWSYIRSMTFNTQQSSSPSVTSLLSLVGTHRPSSSPSNLSLYHTPTNKYILHLFFNVYSSWLIPSTVMFIPTLSCRFFLLYLSIRSGSDTASDWCVTTTEAIWLVSESFPLRTHVKSSLAKKVEDLSSDKHMFQCGVCSLKLLI